MKARPQSLRTAPRRRPSCALLAAALAAAALAPAASWGQQDRPSPVAEPSAILPPAPQPGAALTAEQRAFFRDLALLNARQLSLASEASGRASRSATRDFAEWVRREHQTFAEELGNLSKLLGDETAARAEVPPIKERPAWANREDSGYDEGYVRATAELAGRMVERLESVRRSPETTVAAFAQKHLPGLASRIERAQNLQNDL